MVLKTKQEIFGHLNLRPAWKTFCFPPVCVCVCACVRVCLCVFFSLALCSCCIFQRQTAFVLVASWNFPLESAALRLSGGCTHTRTHRNSSIAGLLRRRSGGKRGSLITQSHLITYSISIWRPVDRRGWWRCGGPHTVAQLLITRYLTTTTIGGSHTCKQDDHTRQQRSGKLNWKTEITTT